MAKNDMTPPGPNQIMTDIEDAFLTADIQQGRVFTFEYLGQAMPKQSVRGGKNGYYPQPKVVKRSNSIKVLALAQANEQGQPGSVCISGPVCIDVIFWFPWTGNISKKVKTFLICNGLEFKTTRPDLDNLEKLLMDALEGIYYTDDKQVVLKRVMKKYSDQPRTQIVIREILIPDK